MNYIINFPKQAEFGRIISKEKIYKHSAGNKTKLAKLFRNEVERIVWSYKLSPETTNISAHGWLQEIQVLTINQREEDLSNEILKAIDKSIPYPVIFQLIYEDNIKYSACYKRQNEADTTKLVLSEYFETDWISKNAGKKNIPVVLNLKRLYENLLTEILPINIRYVESIGDAVCRLEMVNFKIKEMKKLETKMYKEKQFNRQVELNRQLKLLKNEIDNLSGE